MSNFCPDTRGQEHKAVTYLGSLVQLCCGEGGTLQTNITGMCGESLQCLGHAGFVPAHSVCAFLVYTAQAPGCSAGNCPKWALGFVHFPDLSWSGSGSQVLHKGTESVGHAFCALCRSEWLRWPQLGECTVPGRLCVLIMSLAPAAQFPCAPQERHLRYALCFLWELISDCNPPGRCQPSRIPGRLG